MIMIMIMIMYYVLWLFLLPSENVQRLYSTLSYGPPINTINEGVTRIQWLKSVHDSIGHILYCIALANRQCAAWAPTLITHKHPLLVKKKKTKLYRSKRTPVNKPASMPLASRLKMLHNKCYAQVLSSKLDFHHVGWYISQRITETPMRCLFFRCFGTGVTLQWSYCPHRSFCGVFSKWGGVSFYRFFWTWDFFLLFVGMTVAIEPATSLLNTTPVHNITPCLQRHCS